MCVHALPTVLPVPHKARADLEHMKGSPTPNDNRHCPLGMCDASKRRWWQSSREAMEAYQRTSLPQTCPIFNAMLPHILDDTGELHRRGEPGIEQEAPHFAKYRALAGRADE